MMKTIMRKLIFPLLLSLAFYPVWADKFSDTKKIFEDAGTQDYFETAHGYALFPTIGKAGVVFGGAYGEGRVYEKGTHIGDAEMTQITVGAQFGASGFSQVIFFENAAALEKFTAGNFEFGIKAQAVALTASAEGTLNTSGISTTASATKDKAITEGEGYINGMSTFTVTKGGLMYEASLGGQKFNYKPL